MPRLEIPLGSGLDRETGALVVAPTSGEDVRNALIHEGKILSRRGFTKTAEFTSPTADMTDIIGGISLRARRIGIVVGYDSVNAEIHVFKVDSGGAGSVHVGEWTGWTITVGQDPPVIFLTEADGRIFMAHDHPDESVRAPTIFFDGRPETAIGVPNANYLTLVNLTQNWDGLGPYNIKFRGVERYLKYLIGWGYGTNTLDRPELIRISKAGDPETFAEEHYIPAGQRDDPVTRCIPVGTPLSGSLLAFKEFETHEIFGYSRSTFGARYLDPLYGCQYGRLAINVSNNVFVWTAEGPRLFAGSQESQGLDLPLELYQPEPSSLVAESLIDFAFAEYLPNFRVVLFVFGKRVYALTIRNPDDPRWSYWELGFEALCGFRLPATGGGLAFQPTASFTISGAATNIDDTTADITLNNVSHDGDEFVEFWAKTPSRPWKKVATRAVTLATPQAHVDVGGGAGESGFYPGEVNTVRTRAKRGPYFTAGYTDPDPDNWSGASFTVSTTLVQTPTIDSTAWSRTGAAAEQIAVTVTPVHSGTDVEVLRDAVVVHTETAPTGQFTFDDTGVVGETNESYTVRHVTPTTTGTSTGATLQWAGPEPGPTQTSLVWDGVGDFYQVDWSNGDLTLEIEVRDNWTGAAWSSYPQRVAATKAAGSPSHIESFTTPPSGTAEVGVRHKKTTFGTDDYSPDDTDTVTVP